MIFYKEGNCKIGEEEIIVKKNIDVFMEDKKVVVNDNQNRMQTVLLDFQNAKNRIHFDETDFLNIIDNFYEIRKYTYAEITLIDMIALISIFYNSCTSKECTVLEVGSWGGASSLCICKIIGAINEKSKLICMDTWKGTEDTRSHHIANYEDMFLHFKSVMRYFGIYQMITPIISDSRFGLKLLKDDSLDFIFVDAAHTYLGVKNDIEESLPKLKKGGIMVGHDCECYYDELPSDSMNHNIDIEKGYHVGVIKALHELWGNEFNIVPGSKIWFKQIM